MIAESDNAYSRAFRDVTAVFRFGAPEFATHYYSSLGIEFGINLGYFTDELDVTRAFSFVEVECDDYERCKCGDGQEDAGEQYKLHEVSFFPS